MKKLLTIIIWLVAVPAFGAGASYSVNWYDVNISVESGNSWVALSGVDLSAYAGGAYEVYISDGTYTARGITGAVGTGETLGSELVIDPGILSWSGDDPVNFYVNNEDANNYVTEAVGGGLRMVSNNTSTLYFQQSVSQSINKTYKWTLNISDASAPGVPRIYNQFLPGYFSMTSWSGTGEFALYTSAKSSGSIVHRIYRDTSGNTDLTYTLFSVKEVLTPPATGVYVTWHEKPSGLDTSTISSVIINPVATTAGTVSVGISFN